jgi:hypothetical protein
MICEYCKQLSKFQFKNGIFCCSKSVSSCPEIQRRKKETCKVKYGDENFKNPNKGKLTKLQNHGDENYNNSTSAKNTILQIYGVDNISKVKDIKNKKDQTFDKNYRKNSEAHALLIKQKQDTWKNLDKVLINQKRANTCLEKYGVENPLQVTEIFEKTQKHRWKYFTFPSGVVKKIQGCEGLALTDLLKTYQESDIINERKNIPKIKYYFNDKNKIYYPDIFIISNNKIIEVKSDWTYIKEYEKNQAKKTACLAQGYDFEFWVYSKSGLQII